MKIETKKIHHKSRPLNENHSGVTLFKKAIAFAIGFLVKLIYLYYFLISLNLFSTSTK